jgi:hypothetical protein
MRTTTTDFHDMEIMGTRPKDAICFGADRQKAWCVDIS